MDRQARRGDGYWMLDAGLIMPELCLPLFGRENVKKWQQQHQMSDIHFMNPALWIFI